MAPSVEDTAAMSRGFLVFLLLGAPAWAGDGVEAPADTGSDEGKWTPLCIDAVVVARVTGFQDQPIPDYGPDVILSAWTWRLFLDVKHVYLGAIKRGRLTIGATMHAPYRNDFPLVLLLSRQKDSWYLAEREYGLLDASGNYVIPMYEPAADWQLLPEGWMPADYQRWLRPIRYSTRNRYPGLGVFRGDEEDGENEWLRISGGRITMKRGFRVADVPEMLAERRALECHRLE
jgi:hypothetical protein